MKTKALLAAAMLLLLQTVVTAQQRIKVLTFNIYHGEAHYERGTSNLQKIAAVINEHQPDFVAMQEVDSMTNRTARFNNGQRIDIVKELAALTKMNGYFAKAIDYDNGGYGEGVLTKKPATVTRYALPIPKGGEGRAMLQVQQKLANGRTIVFAGNHLCHEFDVNRIDQIKTVDSITQKSAYPVILAGDWNFVPGSAEYAIITKNFKDAAVVKGKPEATFPYTAPKIRLDMVFLSNNAKWKVIDVAVLKNDASDHMPVLVTLELE
ncbi:endonuclease/exonuclease/phosphatase family protein [Terrimonas rubra]|uniref:Endonuclease/exonuclease/phosphatase family protein n=1 Tax=Terrimonas rubra TaxID=1035890 RepID=A0ABW6A4Y1_9BACT